MKRFVIALGHTVWSFGKHPLVKRIHSDDFVVLFGREERPGEWS